MRKLILLFAIVNIALTAFCTEGGQVVVFHHKTKNKSVTIETGNVIKVAKPESIKFTRLYRGRFEFIRDDTLFMSTKKYGTQAFALNEIKEISYNPYWRKQLALAAFVLTWISLILAVLLILIDYAEKDKTTHGGLLYIPLAHFIGSIVAVTNANRVVKPSKNWTYEITEQPEKPE